MLPPITQTCQIQRLKFEVLDKFVIVAERHLN